MTAQADDQVICIIGAGYVGLVTAAGLAERGLEVRVVEIDADRRWRRGSPPSSSRVSTSS